MPTQREYEALGPAMLKAAKGDYKDACNVDRR